MIFWIGFALIAVLAVAFRDKVVRTPARARAFAVLFFFVVALGMFQVLAVKVGTTNLIIIGIASGVCLIAGGMLLTPQRT